MTAGILRVLLRLHHPKTLADLLNLQYQYTSQVQPTRRNTRFGSCLVAWSFADLAKDFGLSLLVRALRLEADGAKT